MDKNPEQKKNTSLNNDINDNNNIVLNEDKEINKKLAPYICKIYNNKTDFENGFLCKIPYPNKCSFIYSLISNNKIIKNKLIMISFENDKIKKFIYYYPERKIYKSEKYNVQIIEIFPDEDQIYNFLEFDENLNIENDYNYKTLNICIPYYLKNRQLSIYSGTINKYEKECEAIKEEIGGCPIILLDTFKVIGINEGKKESNFTLLKYPIFEFNKNEIIIFVNIDCDDLNKDIYILNNPYYTNIDGTQCRYDGLKEINSSNTQMFINDKKCEFRKIRKFNVIGENIIKLKFNIFLTDVYSMFLGCKNITKIDLSSLITKYITNISYMFRDCINLRSINMQYLNMQHVYQMKGIFSGCESLSKIICFFDTSNISNMSFMFYNCKSLKEIDLKKFNTNKVINMNRMFYGCKSLIELNLSSFNTENVLNMNEMFNGCNNLEKIIFSSNFKTNKIINMNSMFKNCNGLINLDLLSFDTSIVTDMSNMFYGCNNLKNLNLLSFVTDNVIDMSEMFNGCKQLINLEISLFKTKNVTNMKGMFKDCINLKNIDLKNIDTKNVTNMNETFANCCNIKYLDLSSFKTNIVEDISGMFCGCKNLEKIDLSSFNTENVTNMKDMFNSCNKLRNLQYNTK